jgi:hypothetical protein
MVTGMLNEAIRQLAADAGIGSVKITANSARAPTTMTALRLIPISARA